MAARITHAMTEPTNAELLQLIRLCWHEVRRLNAELDKHRTEYLTDSLTFADTPPVPDPDYPTEPLGNTDAPITTLTACDGRLLGEQPGAV